LVLHEYKAERVVWTAGHRLARVRLWLGADAHHSEGGIPDSLPNRCGRLAQSNSNGGFQTLPATL
jgi:hypothetical protein